MLAVALAALFVVAVFVAKGGLLLARVTYIEEIAIVVSAVAVIGAIVRYRGQPLHGALALAALGALCILTGLSIGWSLTPDESWLELNRTVAYLGIFALGIAAVRIWTREWKAPIFAAMLTVAVVVIAALATKVAPGVFAEGETFARLREPFGYWNAVALTCALGFPLCLWLGTRTEGSIALNAIAYPLLGLSIVTLFLSFSRGGLLAGALGIAIWLAVVPRRLRTLSVLLPSAAAAGLVIVWAFNQSALTLDSVALSQREDTGILLAILLAVLIAALYAAGYWIAGKSEETMLPEATRRKLGTAAIACVVAAPIVLAGALAFSKEGIDGKVSTTWDSLTSAKASAPGNTPNRFTSAASVRAQYWREAIKIFRAHYWKGSGAGSYAVVRDRYRTSTVVVRQAHGQIVQALADLGIAGAFLTVLAGLLWLAAALGTTGLLPRNRGSPWNEERTGMVALGLVPIVFGIHAAIDWTWYIPGVVFPALVAAGWVAGRGPVLAPEHPTVELPAPAGGPLAALGGPRRAALIVYVLLFAAVGLWTAWQPLRADRLSDKAQLLSAKGDTFPAVDKALQATNVNPLSVDALFALSAVYTKADNKPAGLQALEDAVKLEPANPESWHQLGLYELEEYNDPKRALLVLSNAVFLDPQDQLVAQDFARANQAVQAKRLLEQLRARRAARKRTRRRQARRAGTTQPSNAGTQPQPATP